MSAKSRRSGRKRRLDTQESDDAAPPAKHARLSPVSQLSPSQRKTQKTQQQRPRTQNSNDNNNLFTAPQGVIDPEDEVMPDFERGAIKRISVRNWVTFDAVTIECSPGLNLLVGPNGTGKSSIACAISLGLGGSTQHIGRGDKLSDYIKRGKKEAIIEITLHNAIEIKVNNRTQYRDVIVKRTIRGHNTVWSLNSKVATKEKALKLICNDLNIKVNNKCQFLAQDKVSAFSSLTPVELLEETQLAIEDNRLYTWHQELIRLSKHNNDKLKPDIKALRETLAADLSEKRTIQKDMANFQRSQNLRRECEVLEAKKGHLEAENARLEMESMKKELKTGQKILRIKESLLDPLRNEIEKWQESTDNFDNKQKQLTKAMANIHRKIGTSFDKLEKLDDEIKTLEAEIHTHEKEAIKRASKLRKTEQEVREIVAQLDGSADLNELLSQRKKLQENLTQEREGDRGDRRKATVCKNKQRGVLNNINTLKYNMGLLENAENRKLNQIFQRNPTDKMFYDWVEGNRHEFKGNVYGPIIKHLNVNSDRACMYLERAIGRNHLFAYVVENKEDWVLLSHKVGDFQAQFRNFRAIEVIEQDSKQRINKDAHRCSREKLAANGIDGYLEDTFQAPDVIKLVLNNMCQLYRIGYSNGEPNARQLDNVLRKNNNQRDVLNVLYTSSNVINVKISRYGNNDAVTDNSPIFPYRQPLVTIYIDNKERIAATQAQLEQENRNLEDINQELTNLTNLSQQRVKKVNDFKKEISPIDQSINNIRRLLARKKSKEKQLQQLKSAVNIEKIKKTNETKIAKYNKDRVNELAKYTDLMVQNKNLFMQRCSLKISWKHSGEELRHRQNSLENLEKNNKTLKKVIKKREKDVERLTNKWTNKLEVVNKKYPKKQYVKAWKEGWIKKLNTLAGIEKELNGKLSEMKYLIFDQGKVDRYQKIVKAINSNHEKLKKLEKDFVANREKIEEIDRQWKPQLQAKIHKISKKFSKYFKLLKAQGEVKLIEGDSYYLAHSGLDGSDSNKNNNGSTQRRSQRKHSLATQRTFQMSQLTQQMSQIMSNNNNNNNKNNNNGSNKDNEDSVDMIDESLDLKVARYDDWTIDIMTKFREDQPWTKLSANSQSGGEKSITTMIYLLSLQEVTTVPFRVVDEINQGMDSINERRIMQILNKTCIIEKQYANNTGYNFIPQYFVITPKLLPRLNFAKSTAVFIIYNGPFQMPQSIWNQCTQTLTQATQATQAITLNNNETLSDSDEDVGNNDNNGSENSDDSIEFEEKELE